MHSVAAQRPSGQILQISRTGQSSVTLHCGCGFGGHANWHEPLTQSIWAQVPPGQTRHARSVTGGQSARLLHMPPQFGGVGEQVPVASQYLSTAVSLQAGSFGSHCVHCAPHALPAHG
jgi:hypothetical protein